MIQGRLCMLARKLIQRDNKLQSLRVIGRFRILYIGLKTYEFQYLKQKKTRKMKINATWRKFANKLLQRSYKKKSLKNVGKWN